LVGFVLAIFEAGEIKQTLTMHAVNALGLSDGDGYIIALLL